ncbi:zinc finger protein, partial [Wuchereria bancrofti]
VAHRKAHGQPFIYECRVPGCGQTFDHKSLFYNHKKMHEPRPRCQYCGKSFSRVTTLKYHNKLCSRAPR